MVQRRQFPTRVKILRAIKDKRGEVSVPKRSKIRHLHQFLNDNGIVRVGSILKISYVNKQNKHQVFFPKVERLFKIDHPILPRKICSWYEKFNPKSTKKNDVLDNQY